jgi:predicted TIM-barrel fold metal-dependent hydrolase
MIVDAHIHYFDSPGFVAGLLKDMDEAGVDKAVLLPTIGDSTWEYVGLTFKKVDNEAMLGALRAHPDRFVGGVRVIPTEKDAYDEFMRFVETGYFRLLKLSPPEGFTVDEERIYPIYEQCAKLNFPVLIHMGQTGGEFIGEKKKNMYQLNSSLANPMTLDAVAKAFPDVNFIIAHNGYPYKIEAWALADGNKNVYLDISGSGPWVDGTVNLHNALGGDSFIPIDMGKVLWGSDNCLPPLESLNRADAYVRLMGADKAQRQLIFGGNAEKLFRL